MNIGIGNKITWFDTLASTHDYLNNHLSEFVEGEIVITKNQYSGRGHGNNRWESKPGENLTFSFYVRPDNVAADQQFYLNMAISLGVFDFIRSHMTNHQIKVKWPNDIYIDSGKAGGILIHHAIRGNHILHSVIGIGINVNQTIFVSDAPNPVSMKQFLGDDLDLDVCLSGLCDMLNKRFTSLKKNSLSELKSDYMSALFGSGEWRLYKFNNETISAKIEGISKYGQLQLITRLGKKIECDLKEIEFLI